MPRYAGGLSCWMRDQSCHERFKSQHYKLLFFVLYKINCLKHPSVLCQSKPGAAVCPRISPRYVPVSALRSLCRGPRRVGARGVGDSRRVGRFSYGWRRFQLRRLFVAVCGLRFTGRLRFSLEVRKFRTLNSVTDCCGYRLQQVGLQRDFFERKLLTTMLNIYINIKFVVSHIFLRKICSVEHYIEHSLLEHYIEHYIEHFVLAVMYTHKPCLGCYPYTQTMFLLLQWQVDDFHDRGTNPQGGGGGGPTYYLAKFFPKLHDNERNWTQGGI